MKRAKTDRGQQADASAKSPHAFMAEALGVKGRLVEQRRALLHAALAAQEDALAHDRGYRSDDVDAYFDARAAERSVAKPALIQWRK